MASFHIMKTFSLNKDLEYIVEHHYKYSGKTQPRSKVLPPSRKESRFKIQNLFQRKNRSSQRAHYFALAHVPFARMDLLSPPTSSSLRLHPQSQPATAIERGGGVECASQRPRRSDRHGASPALLLLHQDAALHIGADRGRGRRFSGKGEAAGTRRGPCARRGPRTEQAHPHAGG